MKGKAKIVATLALIGVAFGAGAQSTDQLISDAKAAIIQKLKDPDSATFRNVVYAPAAQGTGGTVCGEVNARNAYGGYAGFTPFFVIGQSALLRDEINAPAFDSIYSRSCGAAASR